jgi:hypothetical protein
MPFIGADPRCLPCASRRLSSTIAYASLSILITKNHPYMPIHPHPHSHPLTPNHTQSHPLTPTPSDCCHYPLLTSTPYDCCHYPLLTPTPYDCCHYPLLTSTPYDCCHYSRTCSEPCSRTASYTLRRSSGDWRNTTLAA